MDLNLEKILKQGQDFLNAILRSKACRFAIKFNSPLESEEVKLLVQETFTKCKRSFICAHGRPTIYPLQSWITKI